MKKYFKPEQKLGLIEELVFNHSYDDDVDLIGRDGVSIEFVHLIGGVLMILSLALVSL